MLPVHNWRIVLGGFLQSQFELNGSVRLWRKAHSEFTNSVTVVQFSPWNTDPRQLAELILQLDHQDDDPDIRIAAFSWGGALAVRLCRQLQRRGLRVRRLVLCDPVYRHSYWLGNWRALFSGIPIRIPTNVDVVDYLFQRQSKPMGHQIELVGGPSVIRSAVQLESDHMWMDDAPEYHQLVEEVFKEP